MVKKTKVVMLMCIAVFLVALVCAGAASAGANDKYIYTVQQWKDNVTDGFNGFGSMTGDETIYIEDDLVFGPSDNVMISTFAGKIDGKGHVISNFVIDVSSSDYVGLVGYCSGSSIKNLTLCNFSVSGKDYVGGLVGYAESTSKYKFENVRIMYGNVTGSSGYVGGLVGYAGYAASVSEFDGCVVENCVVKSGSYDVGGLVGYAKSASPIDGCAVENCIIEGSGNVGGLVGRANSASESEFVNNVSWVNYTWVNATGTTPNTIGSIQGSGGVDTTGLIAPLHVMVYNSSTDAGYNLLTGVDNTFNGTSTTLPENIGCRNVIPGINCGYGVAYLIKVSSYNASQGTATSTPSVATVEGTTVNLSAVPNSGYKFDSWESTGVAITGNTFKMPNNAVTVVAKFVVDAPTPTPTPTPSSSDDIHFAAEYNFTDLGGSTNVKVYYDEIRKTLFVENITPSATASLGNTVLNVTQFGLKDTDVQLIEVDYDVSLTNAPNAFSLFTNAGFNYLGDSLPSGFTIGGVTPYTINATRSEVYIDALGKYTGEAMTVDSNYAVPGQSVNLAVIPLQNYSVYGWSVYDAPAIDSSKLRADSDSLVKLSIDEEGNILYVLTMPVDFSGSAVTVSPKLRDQGSTFVTYVFLDADTYVMEIPADFSLTGINKTVSGKEVNITACDLLEGHSLKVMMNSTNGLDNTGLFKMLSVKDRSAIATYVIGEKGVYWGAPAYSQILINGQTILDTEKIPSTTSIEELIAEGNLKTDLRFTLKQILNQNVIGKYKDKLTFTVGITTA